ncbi:MAG: LysM peptidoglycan-binding domain-containing protein [Candidatus Eisenbacteria bacterium]|uniref:LysM peptidoglycan-binding domain-containing protein n=1 Tax=Eiseniibacteriota bacterium TaxID=2212470 RepID=A0A538S6F8_UNCEI|nr:MAG: LysM peptidoglycan-binding domain-containing protein [Candidatus Eisenbacteria bacterium]TMQ58631.1 MAG: LysM peptidoglycan-binding domain-containing protein [Candidatus Eisenbacteria bacterium]
MAPNDRGEQKKKRPAFSNARTGSSSTASSPGSTTATRTTYTVKKGDNLSKIAREIYGNADEWQRIFEANRDRIEDPDLIEPGQKLKIPG